MAMRRRAFKLISIVNKASQIKDIILPKRNIERSRNANKSHSNAGMAFCFFGKIFANTKTMAYQYPSAFHVN